MESSRRLARPTVRQHVKGVLITAMTYSGIPLAIAATIVLCICTRQKPDKLPVGYVLAPFCGVLTWLLGGVGLLVWAASFYYEIVPRV